MRINKFLAQSLSISRRHADVLIDQKRVTIDGTIASLGSRVNSNETVAVDNTAVVHTAQNKLTIAFHKPKGAVCSRNGQGSRTIYEILPKQFQHLDYIGRLDKNSSGLLILTSDGDLNLQLSHPRYQHQKRYRITLESTLLEADFNKITKYGVRIENDHISTFTLHPIGTPGIKNKSVFRPDATTWEAVLNEGKNRQIRNTFAQLGYTVHTLHRISFGPFALEGLKEREVRVLTKSELHKFKNY